MNYAKHLNRCSYLALNIYITLLGERNRKTKIFLYNLRALFLLCSREKKYFVFTIYVTSILLLYRILRYKDLAIGESGSMLRVNQSYKKADSYKKKKQTKILRKF